MAPSLQSQTHAKLRAAYDEQVQKGRLSPDPAQNAIVDGLQTLQETLLATENPGLFQRLFTRENPRSFYIWGSVGRGKSMLMDLFYATVAIEQKRRVHFHAFMQEVHAMTHAWRHEIESKRLKRDLIRSVAGDIVQDTRLLCLDELQVTDVADAMILSRLFTALLEAGTVIVTTSNRPPEELYQGGLQRESFLDFIGLIRARMEVLELRSPTDYRMRQMKAMQAVYLQPLNAQNTAAFQAMLAQLTHGATLSPLTLEVQGRQVTVPQSYGGIGCFSFSDLCEHPLGAADYLSVARHFHTIFLTGIPMLTPEKRNEARRFVTLIDTLYDHKVKLICTAAAPPTGLYASGDGSFEFQRTISRLAEMQSGQYLEAPHIP